jgi:hypothetical protein
LEQDTELGQLDSATPDRTVFDMLLHVLMIVTKVPTFYFTGDWPSGVALLNGEMRLNHLVEDHQSMLSPALIQTIQTMIRLSNTYAGTTYDFNASIDIQWYEPQILTADLQMELDKNQTVLITTQVAQGVRSIESAVRLLNPQWTESEIQAEVSRIKTDSIIQ